MAQQRGVGVQRKGLCCTKLATTPRIRGVHFPPTSERGLRSTYSVFFAQKLVIFIFHPARFWQGEIKTQLGMHGERKGATDYPAPVARECVRWPMWIVGDSGEGFSF